MRNALLVAALLFCGAIAPPAAQSETYYCDPVNGSPKGDGSVERPWGSLESVVSGRLINGADPRKGKVHAGDTIRLRTGNHGKVRLQGPEYAATAIIVVEGEEGHAPIIESIFAPGLKNWIFRNFSVRSPDAEIPKWSIVFRLIDIQNVHVEGCEIRTAADAAEWGDREWETRCPWYGLHVTGTNYEIRGNRVFGVENGIFVGGSKIKVDRNRVEYFLNDGIEYEASQLEITNNRITDLYNLASNQFHHDGTQGWNNTGSVLSDVLIEGNFIAYSTGRFPKVPPVTDATFQCIVSFDGPYRDVRIRRNVGMATMYQGIAMYNVADSVIEQNTIVYQGKNPTSPCWIAVAVSKPEWGSVAPKNVVLRDNISPAYYLAASGVTVENCFTFTKPPKPWDKAFTVISPEKTFQLYEPSRCEFDLRLRLDSPAAGKPKTIWVGGAGAHEVLSN